VSIPEGEEGHNADSVYFYMAEALRAIAYALDEIKDIETVMHACKGAAQNLEMGACHAKTIMEQQAALREE